MAPKVGGAVEAAAASVAAAVIAAAAPLVPPLHQVHTNMSKHVTRKRCGAHSLRADHDVLVPVAQKHCNGDHFWRGSAEER